MWTSLYNYFCDKFFSKAHKNSRLSEERKDESSEGDYGKRLKLSHPLEGDTKNYVVTTQRFPMQSTENFEKNIVPRSSDDDDECCFVAEIPRRKTRLSNTELSVKKDCGKNVLIKPSSTMLTIFPKSSSKLKDNSDVQIVKWVNHNSSTNPGTSKNYKFFSAPRSTLSQSKISKSKLLFKNSLRKRFSFIQESYRLNEKMQYIQLLESHTSCNFLKRNQSKPKLCTSSSLVPVIDLTEDETSSQLKLEKYFPPKHRYITDTSENASDNEIQIVEEIPKFRSFEDISIAQQRSLTSFFNGAVLRKTKSNDKAVVQRDIETETINENEFEGDDQNSLETKLRTLMQIKDPVLHELETLEGKFTPEQEALIEDALLKEPSDQILSENYGIKITRRDMQTLKGLNWLNDEIINTYMNLIVERSAQNKNLPKVYAFSTFFYTKLITCGYSSLQRWTKKVDVFSFDILLLPIHLGMHWCLSIIDFRSKSIKYFDSIGTPNDSCLDSLLLYLKSESLNKKNKMLQDTGWTKVNVENIPQQMNGSDCGVFTCMFAEYLARDYEITFTQEHMPYFRKKMILEILYKRLLT